ALPESTSKLQAAAAAPARDAGQQMLFEKVAAILTSYGNVLRRALGKLLFSDMPFGDMPYYLVSDKYSPDFIGRAREIAKKGVKVNLIMPMPQGNERMPEGIVVEPLDSVTFGQKSADIFKYSQPSAKNSAAVNIFFFDRQTDMNDFAVKTLEYVDEQIEKRQEKAIPSIIDVQVSGKDETLQNMYPDSVLLKTADAVKSANDDILAQGSDIDVFEAGNIGGMLKTAGEMFKNRKKASDMNNSPILPTTIDISKPGVRLEQFSTPSAINDFKEHSVSVVVVKLGADNALPDEAAFRNFLKNMHAAGLKVAVEYSFGENKLGLFNEWAYGLSGQLDKLSGARAGSKMLLDGIKLNLSGMSASDAMEAAQKFDAVRNALNAHRSGALFGVLSPSFVDENIYKKADIRRITLAVDGSGNALNLSALPENSWVELDYGRTIDTQSTDYAAAESNINGIVEKIINNPNVAMIGIPWDVVQSLEKIKDRPFSVIELMRMIPLAKKAAMLRTPKGRFDSGKELALKRNATVEAANQAAAYNVLADLRGGTNLSAAVEEAKSVLPDSDLIKTLAASYEAAADSYKKDCVLKNIEGYLLGALENTELAAYAKVSGSDLNFVVAENKALLAKAMVNAKLLKVSSEPLNREGEDNAVNVLKQEANMQLQLALKRISDAKDGPFAKDAFANMQEAINILDSLIDSGALSVDSKPIALSELITLLALYADRVPKTAVDKVGDNLAEMVAGARATLVAA
ncbi:MAG: hypothetical protein FWC57_04735, partial [Endomicrobia bacterium]|nr:hypothetical protein [Endomicrobiia bacterium]